MDAKKEDSDEEPWTVRVFDDYCSLGSGCGNGYFHYRWDDQTTIFACWLLAHQASDFEGRRVKVIAMNSKKRKKLIEKTLRKLGGKATTKQIAETANLNINGVSQTLGYMPNVRMLYGGRGALTQWELVS